jgi:exonuclease SbcD
MVKIIHTSDWHIGLDFYQYDRSEEHRRFFAQLCDIVSEEKPDALIVSGDVYHTATPSAAAQKLYTGGMIALHKACPSMTIVVVAGNHDSYTRLESTSEVWRLANVHVVGFVERNDNGELCLDKHLIDVGGKCLVAAIPYVNNLQIVDLLKDEVLSRNKACLPVVVMAHLAVSGSVTKGQELLTQGGLDYESLDVFGNWYDYLALGHIHCPQTLKGSGGKARYCGSPIRVNFDEDYPHSVSVVEVEAGQAPLVREVEIKSDVRFLTVPEKALPLDEALEELRKVDSDIQGFVRLNVLVKDYAPFDADARVLEVMKDKACRFCRINVVREVMSGVEKRDDVLGVQDIKALNPIVLAKRYYRELYGMEMDDDLAELFIEAAARAEQAE